MPKIHIDTDLGGDMDDLCALVMTLRWPGAELIAVTTNQDNAGKRAGMCRYALDLAGRSDIPVAAGADASMDVFRVYAGLPDEAAYWPEPVTALPGPMEAALDLLVQSIEQGALICGIGTYTNLAFLERRKPGILQRANLFLMGGLVFPIRAGYPQWGNEMDWNVQNDIGSAKLVFENSNPTVIPMTMTVETALRRSHVPALQRGNALARLIARQAGAFEAEYNNAKQFENCSAVPRDIINFQHDPLACAIALGWREGVVIEEVPLVFEEVDGWLVERVHPAGKPTRLVTQIDGARFSEHWLEIVTGER
jgi:inosine-uridine nucleoside N-ribohydrolase